MGELVRMGYRLDLEVVGLEGTCLPVSGQRRGQAGGERRLRGCLVRR